MSEINPTAFAQIKKMPIEEKLQLLSDSDKAALDDYINRMIMTNEKISDTKQP